MDKYKNENGTYNGAKALADLSGLSEDEVLWTFNRMKELRRQGHSAESSKIQVTEEAKSQPWKGGAI